jgi:tetratricopeptide (TPR) repeat protein
VSYTRQRRYAEAEGSFRRAIRIQEKLGGDARKDLSITLHSLALTCNKQGRYSEALDLATRALSTREADLANVDSTVIGIMLHKAELLRKVHRKTEAAKLERAARQERASLKQRGARSVGSRLP